MYYAKYLRAIYNYVPFRFFLRTEYGHILVVFVLKFNNFIASLGKFSYLQLDEEFDSFLKTLNRSYRISIENDLIRTNISYLMYLYWISFDFIWQISYGLISCVIFVRKCNTDRHFSQIPFRCWKGTPLNEKNAAIVFYIRNRYEINNFRYRSELLYSKYRIAGNIVVFLIIRILFFNWKLSVVFLSLQMRRRSFFFFYANFTRLK